MAIKRGSKVDIGGSSASMTDLMFLLLIFLMIATTLINSNAIKLDLPKSTAPSKDKVTVVVSIDSERQFYVGQSVVSLSELESAIKGAMVDAEPKRLSLRVDRSVPAEDIVLVMNIAKDNDYMLNLATNPE